MITKLKMCLVGATGVGKTSLVARYLHSVYSDKYLTTIGVKIEAVQLARRDRIVQLVIWDLSGEDEFQSVQSSYIAGAAGFLVVVDGTRRETVDTGLMLANRVRDTIGNVPFVLVVNKIDLVASWELRPDDLQRLEQLAYAVVRTSARTGDGVAVAFDQIADAMLGRLEPEREPQWI